ncbi:hypothetical protein [Kribbella sp.]|uniref:hypothetical protein n=1 Tax=Kribbella sp. TaxID=1871183 RepID=UPI002D32FCE9|nr:hypothetical protein [Kribbella sp.]HZX05132.1 hypothetical protein [Kribbella sp.]
MDPLHTALSLLVEDLRNTGGLPLRLLDEPSFDSPEYESLWLVSGDKSRTGLLVPCDFSQPERVIHVADQLQDFIHEELCRLGLPATWPECPEHPASHPLTPALPAGRPAWQCPKSGHTVGAIGGL